MTTIFNTSLKYLEKIYNREKLRVLAEKNKIE